MAFSPDGQTGRDRRRGRDGPALGACPRAGPSARPCAHPGQVVAVAFSPDGRTVLTGSTDGTARLWEVGHRPADRAAAAPSRTASWPWPSAPTAASLLTGSDDGTARLWDAATGQPLGPPLRHRGAGLRRGLQPRRPGRPDRQRGRDRPALGRGRPASPSARPCGIRIGSAPWPSAPTAGGPDRELGRDGPALGRGHRPADRPSRWAIGTRSRCVAFSPDGTIVPDRQRRHGPPASGTRPPAGPSARPSGTRDASPPWPSAPTAGRS